MEYSTPGLPVHHQVSELAQTHVHWVSDATQPSHPLFSCLQSFPASGSFSMSQLFTSGGQSAWVAVCGTWFPPHMPQFGWPEKPEGHLGPEHLASSAVTAGQDLGTWPWGRTPALQADSLLPEPQGGSFCLLSQTPSLSKHPVLSAIAQNGRSRTWAGT